MNTPEEATDNVIVNENGQPLGEQPSEDVDEVAPRETRIPIPDGLRRRAIFVFDDMADGGLAVAMIKYGWGAVELYGLCEVAKEVIREEAKGLDNDGGPDQSPYPAAAAN